MIPYFSWTEIQLGPLTLYVWGLFVALGFVVASLIAAQFAFERGLKKQVIYDLTLWMLIAGMIGGRMGYVLFYDPATFLQYPMQIFSVWDGGLSVYGGFAACLATALWFFRKRHVDPWKYADAAVFGLPFGLWIGRIGCFLIHDHQGTATDFFLGVKYPDGVTRHDHGLYLSINGLVLGLFFLWLSRKPRPVGLYVGVFSLWYGIVRFSLDFWRAADVTYGGLTPAQYASIALSGYGLWLLLTYVRNQPLWMINKKTKDSLTAIQK